MTHITRKCYYSKKTFFLEVVIPNITQLTNFQRDSFIKMALNNQELSQLLRNVACIPSSPNGTLKKPTDLVHPFGHASKLYGVHEGKFPIKSNEDLHCYSHEICLITLGTLGMTKDHLTWPDIIDRAKTILDLETDRGVDRFKKLLEMIAYQIQSSSKDVSEQYISQLRHIKFLPVMPTPKEYFLQWYSDEQNILYTSWNEAYSSTWKESLCFVAPIIDDRNFYGLPAVQNVLLPQQRPVIDTFLQQHAVLKKYFAQLPSESIGQFSECCINVYKQLNTYIHDSSENGLIWDHFQCTGIFIEPHFVFPDEVAFQFEEGCSPWLNCVPSKMKYSCESLCKLIGINDIFIAKDFHRALKKMEAKYQNNGICQQLDDHTLEKAVRLVQGFASSSTGMKENDWKSELGDLFVPDENGILRSSSYICFEDSSNLSHCKKDHGIYFAHPKLSFLVRNTILGVKSLRQHVVSKRSLGIPFGQRNPLSRRIQRLLENYPCDEGILKEMVQNADDAGAKRIHFILDERTHNCDNLLSDGWKHLQGPALFVYNDAVFTDNDLNGIKELGLGSKSEDLTKTGQYGVGFNCVYHLTDTPTFLTKINGEKEVLVAFDPNLNCIEEATEEEPGIMYYTDDLREMFPNVFSTYCIRNHESSKGNGTLFRFPLRTQHQIDNFLWKKLSNSITTEKVKALMELFRNEMRNISVFVNNIQEIALCKVDRCNNFEEIYNIKTSMESGDYNAKKEFLDKITSDTRDLQEGKILIEDIQRTEITSSLVIEDNTGLKEYWAVVQSFGFDNQSKLKDSTVAEAYKVGDIKLLPRGGVAAFYAKDKKSKSQISDSHIQNLKKRFLFCFLPLPLESKLPVHVNGHFSLNHESRRQLWEYGGKGYKTEWNNFVMQEIIAPSYVSLLKYLQVTLVGASRPYEEILSVPDENKKNSHTLKILERHIEKYNQLFPKLYGLTEPYIKHMVESFYKILHTKHEMLLPVFRKKKVGGEFVLDWFASSKYCEKEAVVRSISFSTSILENKTEEMRQEEKHLGNVLIDCGYCFFTVPFTVEDAFQKLELTLPCSTPNHVLNFFVTHSDVSSSCLIQDLPKNCEDTCVGSPQNVALILNYCSLDKAFSQDKLAGSPLQVTEDGKLSVFQRNNDIYFSKYTCLVPQCAGMFLHFQLLHCLNWRNCGENPVTQPLTMDSFSKIIHFKVDEDRYKSCETYLEWDPLKSKINWPWLYKFWKFLQDCCEERKASLSSSDVYDQQTLSKLYHETVEPLSTWSLVPGKAGDRYFLVPLGQPQLLVDLEVDYQLNTFLQDAMQKLQFPQIVHEILLKVPAHCENLNIACSYLDAVVSTVSKPKLFFDALKFWTSSDLNAVKLVKFEKDEIKAILDYIAEHIESIKDIQLKLALKKLPIFENILGSCVPVAHCQAEVVPSLVPFHGLQEIAQKLNVCFFKTPKEDHRKLFKILDMKLFAMCEFYLNFVFPNIDIIKTEMLWKHIKMFVDIWRENHWKEKDLAAGYFRFMETLKMLQFVPRTTCSTERARPKDFFSPDEPVFQCMLSDTYFPPVPPKEIHIEPYEWVDFFKALGLITEVSAEFFIKFAVQLERESSEKSSTYTNKSQIESLSNKAHILLENLFYNQRITSHFTEQINRIKFIPLHIVDSDLCSLKQQHCKTSQRYDFVSLTQGVFYTSTNAYLAWTSAKLLPSHMQPKQYKCKGKRKDQEDRISSIYHGLDIHDDVPVDMVVQNVKNISAHIEPQLRSNEKTNIDFKLLCLVLDKAYKFLQEKMTEADVESLKNWPFIVVEGGRLLVKANQISIDMSQRDEIPPYLYRIPIDLGHYHELFTMLGATKSPVPQQFINILTELHQKYNTEKVSNPNDQICANKALFQLMVLFKHTKNETDKKIPEIFVLSASNQFARITDLCYPDDVIYKGRISGLESKLLEPFGNMKRIEEICTNPEWRIIQSERDKIFSNFPESAKPIRLSEFTVEKCTAYTRLDNQTKKVTELQQRFKSDLFLKALIRLLKHNENATPESVTLAIQKLQSSELLSVSELKTSLFFKDELVPDSNREICCHIDIECQPAKIHVNEGMEWNLRAILPQRLDKKLLNELADNHILAQILEGDIDKLEKILDDLQVAEDHSNEEFITLPHCGDFIPIEDHHLLCQGIEVLRSGEYVGYVLEDDETDDGETVLIFIYAQIIEEVSILGSDVLMKKYKIDVGNGETVEVPVIQLYRFHKKYELLSGPLVPLDAFDGSEDRPADRSLDQVQEEIRKILESAWKLSEVERKSIIRRLLRQWHPDKNRDNAEFCTKVCQFISEQIQRLQRGENVCNFTESTFNTYYQRAGSWARNQGSYRERYQEHWSEGGYRYRTGDPPPSFCRRNPQKGEAKRWMRQANYDLKAASTDMDSPSFPREGFHEWSCFKSHQAAEKALKAAQYALDASNVTRDHDLTVNASRLDDTSISLLAARMESLVKSSTHMRYPDRLRYPDVPHDLYDSTSSDEALKLAQQIVKKCEIFIDLRP